MREFWNEIKQFGEICLGYFRRFGSKSKAILLLSIFIVGTFVYCYIVNFSETDFDIFPNISFAPPREYIFFSGNPLGTYYLLGDYLEKESVKGGKIMIRNRATVGGYENANNIKGSYKSSFSISQSDTLKSIGTSTELQSNTLKKVETPSGKLVQVVPLYMEQMHIIFNKNKYYEYSGVAIEKPLISINPHSTLLKFFSKATVEAGPVGSGTQVIATYLTENIYKQLKDKNDQAFARDFTRNIYGGLNNSIFGETSSDQTVKSFPTILNDNVDEAIRKLKSGNVDVVFFIGGAPNSMISELLTNQKSQFGLMTISPSMIQSINMTHHMELQNTGFTGIFESERLNNVSTLGTYAQLITDESTPKSDILALLELIDNLRVGNNIPQEYQSLVNIFRNENVLERYKKGHPDIEKHRFRSFLLFIITSITLFISSLVSLVWVLSHLRVSSYTQKINVITKENSPINESQISNSEDQSQKSYSKDQSQNSQINLDLHNIAIKKIMESIKSFEIIKNDILTDTSLIESHRTNLKEKLGKDYDLLCQNMARNLNELIESKKIEISEEILRHYFTNNYISRDYYDWLKAKLINTDTQNSIT